MNPEQSQPPGSPIPGVAIVIALIVGVLFVTDIPYKSSRPKNPDDVKPLSSDTEDVRARLWEDPFTAVKRHRKKLESGKHKSCQHNEQRLIREIHQKKKSESGDVVVLGVMVFGGTYAENIERRIRSRYAILSALATLGYVPEDEKYLGYIENQSNNKRIPEIIPYEWLIPCKIKPASKPKPPVLLLWLKDDAFSPNPLKKLGELKNLLEGKANSDETCETWCPLPIPPDFPSFEGKANSDGTPELIFKVVGPAGSTTLMAMVKEIFNGLNKNSDTLKGIEIFSSAATVDDNLILKQNKIDRNLNIEDIEDIEDLFKQKLPDVKFVRTIGTDKLLTDALLDELVLRGVDPKESHIVLVSEWDTFYGRTLPFTFSESVKDRSVKDCSDVETAQKNIHRFSYLRGIDGQIPDGSNSNISNAASLNGEKQDKKDQALEKTVGQNQLDYIRRLAASLKDLDKQLRHKDGYGVKAIGVLGSDVYDKLLLLQALHAEFQNVIFFTTDLDVRLLSPDGLEWTRNLVIASNFGLQLNQLLQKNIPPFRDSYQTSMFFSTLIAMNSSKAWCNQNIINEWLSKPRIFEVGKNGAVDLSHDKNN
ncbi:MAG: hypothetical protein JJV92_07410, partial [Desulfosarcina sp.]|nr:hypothetical protein [Desulfobacterales bacterium]